MRRRAAHVQISDGRLVLGPTRRRSQKEKLLKCQLALEDVSFRKPKVALDIERRQHLPVQDQVANVWCVFGDRVDYCVTKLLTFVVPVSLLQVVGRVLNEA